MPDFRLLEIKNFVESGLNDFSISRLKEKMPWGVPVPNDDSQVMYVWFDALVNYISTLGWPDTSGEFSFWPGVQVAGKDNLRQQSAMWQAMLMSAGIEPSRQIFIHGFITANGQKMSKSLGNVVDPFAEVTEYGTDVIRYYLLREIPPGDDGDFSRSRLEERYTELANRLGNLVGRVAAMTQKYFAGDVGVFYFDVSHIEKELEGHMSNYNFKAYVDRIFSVVDDANELIDKKAPFKLIKEDEAAAKAVLAEASEMIRFVARSLACVIPQTSEEILRRYGTIIETGDPLFPRREK
jgi:methionyl-tRNA synthetase